MQAYLLGKGLGLRSDKRDTCDVLFADATLFGLLLVLSLLVKASKERVHEVLFVLKHADLLDQCLLVFCSLDELIRKEFLDWKLDGCLA